ncbi:MAG TPA: GNAT family N-acetyltransferase [Bacteroidales bacterium]|nr:GNAT family N-acetyltransferase [Bacteroidales bacterium]
MIIKTTPLENTPKAQKDLSSGTTMEKYVIRKATLNDVDFIVQTIVEAEKSGSNTFSYARIFNLAEEEVKLILRNMLLEEIDGCEFSISSYLVAEWGGQLVAAVGALIENEEHEAAFVKKNLLSYFIPKESLKHALCVSSIISELMIDHEENVLSLIAAFVVPEHRGNKLFGALVNEHIRLHPDYNEVALQVMSNNIYAIRSYEQQGLKEVFRKTSSDKRILDFLSATEKIYMKKSIVK